MAQAQMARNEPAYHRITEILGCKWSLAIFDAISRGVTRPGRIEREYEGLTTKVLHRCLNRLELDGVLTKTVYPQIPPRVEYSLSEKGERLVELLRSLRSFADDWGQTDFGPAEEPSRAVVH